MKNISLFAIMAALAFGAASVQAKDTPTSKAVVKALASVPAAELPAAATAAVMQAPKGERAAMAAAVIKKVAKLNSAALRHAVASITKADPTLAATVAGAAAKADSGSVALFAAAACNAAPEKAGEVIAECSSATVVGRTRLADMVAKIEPSFAADTLGRQAEAFDVTSSASTSRGGTVLLPRPTPGQLGQTILGDPVTVAPTTVGPGRPGFDPDRYAGAGS